VWAPDDGISATPRQLQSREHEFARLAYVLDLAAKAIIDE
jgi:hypothetical protein